MYSATGNTCTVSLKPYAMRTTGGRRSACANELEDLPATRTLLFFSLDLHPRHEAGSMVQPLHASARSVAYQSQKETRVTYQTQRNAQERT